LSLSARRGRPRSVLDLGCGSGVLAIAVAKLWRLPVIATDIDPMAVEVARENCRSKRRRTARSRSRCDGLDHPVIRAGAPYELILANILASPLTRLAPALSAALARGGTVVLSGLLRSQRLWC